MLFRRTKSEPEVAAELPDKIDELDHCTMTAEQIGLYQAVLDELVAEAADPAARRRKQARSSPRSRRSSRSATIPPRTATTASRSPGGPASWPASRRSSSRVFAAGERVLVFTHFATWGRRLAAHLTEVTGHADRLLRRRPHPRRSRPDGHRVPGRARAPGAMVLSLKAGGTGLNLTAANHVVLYDRWWNPAVEDQARDRAWRIGQDRTVISHRLVCPGTVDERVEEVVAGKRHIAELVLPRSSSIADLNTDQLASRSGCDPTSCSPRRTNEPAPPQAPNQQRRTARRNGPLPPTSGEQPTRCQTSNRSPSPTKSARSSDPSAIHR